jgi:hypothetical protein
VVAVRNFWDLPVVVSLIGSSLVEHHYGDVWADDVDAEPSKNDGCRGEVLKLLRAQRSGLQEYADP